MVANAAPSAVLPQTLSRAFVHEREYPVIDNEYRNGESQRSAQASTSRKKWTLTKRLTPSQLATLRTFYDARNGSHEPFYFYDPYETNPKFSYDPTGAALAGDEDPFAGPADTFARRPDGKDAQFRLPIGGPSMRTSGENSGAFGWGSPRAMAADASQ